MGNMKDWIDHVWSIMNLPFDFGGGFVWKMKYDIGVVFIFYLVSKFLNVIGGGGKSGK